MVNEFIQIVTESAIICKVYETIKAQYVNFSEQVIKVQNRKNKTLFTNHKPCNILLKNKYKQTL